VLTHVRGQDLHDRTVIVRRFACKPLERVDPAQANVEAFLIAELIDCSRKALCDQACLV